MAEWKPMTVRDVITEIRDNKIVLPVIQRRLEWTPDKMEMLFDSLFKQSPFGSIICIEEEKDFEPLFAHRTFTLDGNYTSSFETDIIRDNNLFLVIDGQQRLQSFYMGLCGTYYGMKMYYDLFSDYEGYEYDFRFSRSEKDMPQKNSDRKGITKCFWYPAYVLFDRLKSRANTRLLAKNIIKENGIIDPTEQEYIRENIAVFNERIFVDKSIGISKVTARMSDNIAEDRQRITELFRRLNFEGMKLSTLDLVASVLKSFDYRMENFIDEVSAENSSIGIDQDVLIKLLLILNDKPSIEITELNAEDAKFVADNRERIKETLCALKKFLHWSGHEKWFDAGKKSAIRKSAIPLYFLAYHIFHQERYSTEEIKNMFIQFDINDENFKSMSEWLSLSLLNQVFRKVCGWIPNKTGINRIHEVMFNNKDRDFPLQELFDLYRSRLNRFIDSNAISPANLDMLDQEYMFYMIYDGTIRSSMRPEDKDHIHPRSLLEKAGVDSGKINSIGNLQLIDSASNRGYKSDKSLSEWLDIVDDKNAYIKRHLIPDEPRLWDIDGFDDFLDERLRMIADKIKTQLQHSFNA